MKSDPQPPTRDQDAMEFSQRPWNVHIGQGHFAESSVEAGRREWRLLSSGAHVVPATPLIVQQSRSSSLGLNIDTNDRRILYVQAEGAPGPTSAAP